MTYRELKDSISKMSKEEQNQEVSLLIEFDNGDYTVIEILKRETDGKMYLRTDY